MAASVRGLGTGQNTARIYLDGEFLSEDTGEQEATANWVNMRIGVPGNVAQRQFDGQLRDIRVYKTVLGDLSIQRITCNPN